jgi:predicted ATPase
VSFGGDFIDLIYGKIGVAPIEFSIKEGVNVLSVEIAQGLINSDPSFLKWSLNNELDLKFHKEKRPVYIDEISEEKFHCSFEGLELTSMLYAEKDGSGTIPTIADKFSLKIDYLGPYRVEPKREGYTNPIKKEINQIGIKGEGAYDILINDSKKEVNEVLDSVNNWYSENFDGWKIDIDKNEQQQIYYFNLYRENSSAKMALSDVGQGISQILPLVTRAKMKDEKSVLITIEEPELHLHPAAHGNLAELFVESLTDGKKNYLIETHSQNFVLRLRRLIAESKYSFFTPNDLIIYSVEYNEYTNQSQLTEITVDDLGDVSFWPENVFNESLDEIFGLRKAQKLKANAG